MSHSIFNCFQVITTKKNLSKSLISKTSSQIKQKLSKYLKREEKTLQSDIFCVSYLYLMTMINASLFESRCLI